MSIGCTFESYTVSFGFYYTPKGDGKDEQTATTFEVIC